MTKQRAIILDCDEVLLNWPLGFVDFYNKQNATEFVLKPYHDSIENLFGLAHEDIDPFMYQYNVSAEFFDMPVMKGAPLLIDKIKWHNKENPDDQVRVIILTKCGTDIRTRLMREAQLKDKFGLDFVFDLICLDIFESKKSALNTINSLYNVLVFVDDYVGNCEKGMELGIKTYAVQTYHNAHLVEKKKNITWCSTVDAVANKVSILMKTTRK